MKENPILFNGDMVRAILDDRKKQTRRIVNPAPPDNMDQALHVGVGSLDEVKKSGLFRFSENRTGDMWPEGPLKCPKGRTGDQLWVKETFFAWGRWETRFSQKKGRDEWHFVDMTSECGKEYLYAADGVDGSDVPGIRGDVHPRYWKRPSIFMPRAASRITLEITDVRVERLQRISKEDALKEGVYPGETPTPEAWPEKFHDLPMPVALFGYLWETINGPDSWAASPWVWVVEFKRITP